MTTHSHRSALLFREAVAMLLNGAGLDVTPRKTRRSLAGAFSEPASPSTDVTGVPGVSFLVRAQRVTELSRSLDMARSIADHDGAATAVAVLRRVGRPLGDQYALLSLADLSRLLEERKLT
jgi:hypothetical protein